MKNGLINLLLLLFSTVLALLLVEVGYRVYLFGLDGLSFEKVNSVKPLGVSGLIQPSPITGVVYELRPSLDVQLRLTGFRTNSRGLRDAEYSVTKPAGTFRVAVVGDSYTMPAGVAIEEAYHSVLEARANEEGNEEGEALRYEFINFGVGGYSLRQYWAVVQHKVMEYEPDLIMIGFCARNDYRLSPEELEEPYVSRRATRPFFESFIIKQLRLVTRQWEARSSTGGAPGDTLAAPSETERDHVANIFSEMKALSGDRAIPVVVAYLDNRYQRGASKIIEDIVRTSGLHFVDASRPFEGTDIRDYRLHAVDEHPNGTANRLFADQILQYLDETGLLGRDE